MTITHHPEPESLMSCSAGSMPEAFAAVMSAHITVCPQCQKDLALMQTIGETMFDKIPPAPVTRDAPVIALRSGEADTEPDSVAEAVALGDVPAPLTPMIGHSLDAVAWKRVGPGVWQHAIELAGERRGSLRLIKIAPGMALPEHGHGGSELTLILRGAFRDETGTYGPGDITDLCGDHKHSPVADPDLGCICLAAMDGRMQFKGLVAKIVQSLSGF